MLRRLRARHRLFFTLQSPWGYPILTARARNSGRGGQTHGVTHSRVSLFSRRSSMRPRTVAILLTARARAAAAARWRRRFLAVTVLAGLVVSGCSAALTRPPVTQPELLALRTRSDEQTVTALHT